MDNAIKKVLSALPTMVRAALGLFLRSVSDTKPMLEMLAQHTYEEHHHGEPPTPWTKLTGQEKGVWRHTVTAVLGGLDNIVKQLTASGG